MIRRAWLWAFGPGHFGGALIWTVTIGTLALSALVLALGLPLAFLAWVLS